MGNAQPGGVHRRDRRREMTFLFYFVFGFVLIRVWIILIESKNIVVEAVGGVITFLLLLSLVLRYRVLRDQDQRANGLPGAPQQDVNNPDIALLQSLFRAPPRGLPQEIIDSLHSYPYCPGKQYGMPAEMEAVVFGDAPAHAPGEGSEQPLGNVVGDLENQTGTYSHNPSATGGMDDSVTACSICLSEYCPEEVIMMLPCRHVYHSACVTEWLLAHTQCPLCKQDVLDLLEQRLYVTEQIARLRAISAQREEHIVYDADEPAQAFSTAPMQIGQDASSFATGSGNGTATATGTSSSPTGGGEQNSPLHGQASPV